MLLDFPFTIPPRSSISQCAGKGFHCCLFEQLSTLLWRVCGGPFQQPHLATTYAATAALVSLGGEEALGCVNRKALYDYLLRMCVSEEHGGGMTMCEGGEVDVRGCYCALATCHMLRLDKVRLAEACSLSHFVSNCQVG